MASTKTDRGGGPGTYTSKGVRCTMDPPFKAGLGKGSQTNMGGIFDQPRSGGDNGLPTRVTDRLGGPSKGPKPGYAASAPSAQGPIRKATSR
jgi:hypothetical protein